MLINSFIRCLDTDLYTILLFYLYYMDGDVVCTVYAAYSNKQSYW